MHAREPDRVRRRLPLPEATATTGHGEGAPRLPRTRRGGGELVQRMGASLTPTPATGASPWPRSEGLRPPPERSARTAARAPSAPSQPGAVPDAGETSACPGCARSSSSGAARASLGLIRGGSCARPATAGPAATSPQDVFDVAPRSPPRRMLLLTAGARPRTPTSSRSWPACWSTRAGLGWSPTAGRRRRLPGTSADAGAWNAPAASGAAAAWNSASWLTYSAHPRCSSGTAAEILRRR